MATALETRLEEGYQAEALEATRKEYKNYFDALEEHPRMLVGREVPALDGSDRKEKLRDSEDAADWQDAVKRLLVNEIRSQAAKSMEDNADFLTTVHASIDLFKDNPDLIPGSKDFDVDVAERFTAMAAPYELVVDGKLHGYSIPVQGLIDHARDAVAKDREKAAAAPAGGAAAPASPAAGAGPSTPAAPAAAATPTPEPPQAGIASKAGSGADDAEDFSVLFGTIGLPNLRI